MTRIGAVLVTVAAVLLIGARPGSARHAGAATGVQRMASLDSQVLAQINALRVQHGLRALRLSARLSAASAQHSEQMARRGYFAHESLDGTTMPDRLEHFYPSAGHRYWSVGENLMWESPTATPADVLDAWLGSPPHRANLLSREWREIGLAAVHATSAPGYFGNSPVTIVTTDFGVRR